MGRGTGVGCQETPQCSPGDRPPGGAGRGGCGDRCCPRCSFFPRNHIGCSSQSPPSTWIRVLALKGHVCFRDPVQVVWGTESPSFTWYTRRPLVDLSERTMKTTKIRLGILCCTTGQGQGGWRSGCGVHTPARVLATYGMEESFPPRPAWSLTGWKKAWKMNLNNLITDEVISI